jgi:hypothetical protein
MANEMENAIKGNERLDIRAVAVAGDAALAAAILANTEPADTVTVADTAGRYTGENVEVCLAEIAGADRTTETVKGNAAAIAKLNSMYQILFAGVDASIATANSPVYAVTPGAVPAVGDKIVAITSARAIADMSPAAMPAIVATNASNGFVQALILDGTVQIAQGVGSDLSDNTYTALVLKA